MLEQNCHDTHGVGNPLICRVEPLLRSPCLPPVHYGMRQKMDESSTIVEEIVLLYRHKKMLGFGYRTLDFGVCQRDLTRVVSGTPESAIYTSYIGIWCRILIWVTYQNLKQVRLETLGIT